MMFTKIMCFTINAGEGVEKKEPFYTVCGNANQYRHYGEQCGYFFKKLEIELPYDPAIAMLGIHTEETRIERDACTPMWLLFQIPHIRETIWYLW